MSTYATTSIENQQAEPGGHTLIAGIDEVGRGALAGPLVSVCFVRSIDTEIHGVKDSKCLTPHARMQMIGRLFALAHSWGTGIVESDEITQHGMSWAVRESFERALSAIKQAPDIIFYDGRTIPLSHPRSISVINGDATHASIAAASVVAKVLRDTIMIGVGEDYPQFNFHKNKGYGTADHMTALRSHGLIDGIHRPTFIHL